MREGKSVPPSFSSSVTLIDEFRRREKGGGRVMAGTGLGPRGAICAVQRFSSLNRRQLRKRKKKGGRSSGARKCEPLGEKTSRCN